MKGPVWAAAAMIAGVLSPSQASAATYDPDLTWRTIVTEHFRINFHQSEEQLAEEFSHMVEDVYDTMTEELKWRPRMRTEVVLIDRTDRANGFASAVPYNAITIFVTAPQEDSTLSLYEDWSKAIFTHELTHVIHLETNHGIVAAARAVVGRIASTNDVSPWWVVEGFATFQETRHTSGGRGRSPFVDMIKRASVLEDDFPPLGNLDGLQPDPPGGNLRYLFGQDFIQYVADHAGADSWTKFIHHYGSSIPYILPSKKSFGKLLVPYYFEWKDHLYAEYGAQAEAVRAEGLREGRLISQGVNQCSAPSFAPDDSRLVWNCYDLKTGSSIWTANADGTDAKVLKQDFGAKTFTWRGDGTAFVYAATHVVNRFNTWSDIFMFDVRSKSARSLTRGKRARDPDFSPDGTRLVMVTNKAQDTQLAILKVDQTLETITDAKDHTQFATPRWSPDGTKLAVAVWQFGRRDLWIYSDTGEPLRRLTHDAANDRDPSWSKDGKWLFFSSDRSGIPNVYAIDTQTERLWQVTNVLTGASRPSVNPEGTLLAYEQYSHDGFDVRLMELDPARWIDRGMLPRPVAGGAPLTEFVPLSASVSADPDVMAAWSGEPLHPALPGVPSTLDGHAWQQDSDSIDTFNQERVDDAFGEEEDYPFTIEPVRYNPWPALLPRYILPSFQTLPVLGATLPGPFAFMAKLPPGLNIGGLQAALSSGSSDPLRHYGWSGWASYRTDANAFGGGASFTLNRWIPIYSFSANTFVTPRFYSVVDPEATATAQAEADAAAQAEALAAGEDATGVTAAAVDPIHLGTGLFFERRVTASAAMSYPFTARSTVFANYSFQWRQRLQALHEDADPDTVPLQGTLGTLSAGYRYSWSQPTAHAISREDARTVSLVGALTHPYLGSFALNEDGTRDGVWQLNITAELREYIVNPLAPNHVFALRGAVGASLGPTRFLGNYSLGGTNGESAFYSTTPGYRMIRGYSFGADQGDTFWLAGVEYRLPLFRVDRGLGTLPAFLRVLSGAVYVDAGNAFTTVDSFVDVFDDTLVGVGGEIRASTVLWWGGSVTARLGYGTGLTQNGIAWNNPAAWYFNLGGSF